MQDRNNQFEVLMGKVGEEKELLGEDIPADVVQRTIAKLPQKGQVVQIRGLDFEVRFVNNRTGEMRLVLVRGSREVVENKQSS
jgi:DNA/RNA endonuclease YhcR with UshA esterase domain